MVTCRLQPTPHKTTVSTSAAPIPADHLFYNSCFQPPYARYCSRRTHPAHAHCPLLQHAGRFHHYGWHRGSQHHRSGLMRGPCPCNIHAPTTPDPHPHPASSSMRCGTSPMCYTLPRSTQRSWPAAWKTHPGTHTLYTAAAAVPRATLLSPRREAVRELTCAACAAWCPHARTPQTRCMPPFLIRPHVYRDGIAAMSGGLRRPACLGAPPRSSSRFAPWLPRGAAGRTAPARCWSWGHRKGCATW